MKHHPDTLLCESCGYVLAGLPQGGSCPECGRPVAASLPERRVGSPWQQGASARSLLMTARRTYTMPRKIWEEVRVEARRSNRLTLIVCALAAAWWWAQFVAIYVMRDVYTWFAGHSRDGAMGPGGALFLVLLLAGAAVCLWSLCRIEAAGIRFFARRHGWRTTREVAAAVVGHASPMWLAGAPAGLVGTGLLLMGGRSDAAAEWISVVGGVVWLAQFPIGLIAFEATVYAGWRRLRFANRPRGAA